NEEELTRPEPEPEPEHQGEGDEFDVEQAIQMSLESFQAQSQAHVGSVAIRELHSRGHPTTPSVDTDKTNSGGDTEILQIDEEQGKDVDNQVNLKEKTDELDQGQTGLDPGKTLESRPQPEQEFMDKDQARPDPRVSR
nr:hypothetical protein [Tanacetum cinerariifolium]